MGIYIDAFPFSRYQGKTQKPHPQGYPADPKTIGEHIRKRRMDVGLYQTDVARLLKVTEDCVCYWENGRSHPHLKYYPAIIAFLGYYPFDHETETFGGKIRRYKYEHGLNNKRVAKLLGADEGTVANWERNKRVPAKKRMKYVLSVITNTSQK
jgi:DNA-binding transcriptional regulator YiaG